MLNKQRLPIRLINTIGPYLPGIVKKGAPLDQNQMIEQACNATGLRDLGAEPFLQPMQRLIDSYNRESKLNFLGRMTIGHRTTGLIANRLKIADALQKWPAIREEKITRPIFILGMPRTGTTLLYNLLNQDTQLRAPLFWEGIDPAPPPATQRDAGAARIAKAKRVVRFMQYVAPRMKIVHALQAERPEEYNPLLANTFLGQFFTLQCYLQEYLDWLQNVPTEDRQAAYRYLKTQLQVLQFQQPALQWVLKSAFQLNQLDVVLDVFPDACILHTHRDPINSVASICSLLATSRSFYSDQIDPKQIGSEVLYEFGRAAGQAAEARQKMPAECVFDVQYNRLVADPIAYIRGIYQYFNLTWNAEIELSMQKWLRDNPRNKHGRHQYALSEFGLDERAAQAVFHMEWQWLNSQPHSVFRQQSA